MFTSGLLGGFGHCIGMCGPIVATYSLNLKGRYLPHLLYNLGRITTYTIIGGIMGLTGSFVGVVKFIKGLQNITMAFAGIMMVLMGLGIGGWLPFLKGKNAPSLIPFIARAMRSISEVKTISAFYPMGVILGFLPCGILYTAFIAAAGVGMESGNQIEGFLKGMLMLFLFGVGTFPSLFLFGKFVSVIGEKLRGKLYKGSAILIILMGIIFVYRSLKLWY
jgi:sulfite exporter TauE/SafE